jgi:hypothetical protein
MPDNYRRYYPPFNDETSECSINKNTPLPVGRACVKRSKILAGSVGLISHAHHFILTLVFVANMTRKIPQ